MRRAHGVVGVPPEQVEHGPPSRPPHPLKARQSYAPEAIDIISLEILQPRLRIPREGLNALKLRWPLMGAKELARQTAFELAQLGSQVVDMLAAHVLPSPLRMINVESRHSPRDAAIAVLGGD